MWNNKNIFIKKWIIKFIWYEIKFDIYQFNVYMKNNLFMLYIFFVFKSLKYKFFCLFDMNIFFNLVMFVNINIYI